MLKKSPRSALILSVIVVLSFSLVSAIVNIVIPYLLTGDVHVVISRPEALQEPGAMLTLELVILVTLLVMVLIGWIWLYRYFGERYYGQRGVIFWALFGALLALLFKLPDWLLSGRLAWLQWGWNLLAVFLAFFLSRRLAGIRRTVI